MQLRLVMLAPVVAFALALAGVQACGSGSSGFRPRPAELASILDSAETGTCQEAPGGITVCARFSEAGEGGVCDSAGPGCDFEEQLQLTGFSPGSRFVAAVEPQDLSLLWRTNTEPFGPADADGNVSATIRFVTDIEPGAITLIAIVIYPPGAAVPGVGPLGEDVPLLSDLGAPEARVLADWPLDPPDGG